MQRDYTPQTADIKESIGGLMSAARNAMDGADTELGYVQSILHAITVLAELDAAANKSQIIRLANCAHWVAENLDSNVEHFGSLAIKQAEHIKGIVSTLETEAAHG